MNVNELTDREKSIMLAKLAGWISETDGITTRWHSDGELIYDDYCGGLLNHEPLNLYKEKQMYLAWRLLSWATNNDQPIDNNKSKAYYIGYLSFGDLLHEQLELATGAPPEEAQRLWLDKILELATEAGMLK